MPNECMVLKPVGYPEYKNYAEMLLDLVDRVAAANPEEIYVKNGVRIDAHSYYYSHFGNLKGKSLEIERERLENEQFMSASEEQQKEEGFSWRALFQRSMGMVAERARERQSKEWIAEKEKEEKQKEKEVVELIRRTDLEARSRLELYEDWFRQRRESDEEIVRHFGPPKLVLTTSRIKM